jgi:hypothetical protein
VLQGTIFGPLIRSLFEATVASPIFTGELRLVVRACRSSGVCLIPGDEVPQSRAELGPVANADLPEHV